MSTINKTNTSQRTPGKRKESEERPHNLENLQPNIAWSSQSASLDPLHSAKKVKISTKKVEKQIPQPTKIRSALPRPNFVRSATAEPKKNEVLQEIPVATPSKSFAAALKGSTPLATQKIPSSTSKFSNVEPTTPNTGASSALVRRLQKSIALLQPSDLLKGLFESAFTFNDEKIADIINPKASKSKATNKYDFKDKLKVQSNIITDVRNAVKTTFDEIKTLREKCYAAESANNVTFRDAVNDFQEGIQLLTTLTVNDSRLKKEIARLSEELAVAASSIKMLEKENAPIKSSLKELEAKQWSTMEKLATEEALRVQAEAEVLRLRKDIDVLKQESTEVSLAIRNQYEQRIDQAVSGYRDEISILRQDLGKKQSDNEKSLEEKADVERKISELSEKIFSAQSSLRESENTVQRLEKDNNRLCNDIEQAKVALTHKEADLRATLNSLNDIQRHSNEEKSGLRAEISNYQNKIQSLEDERNSSILQLSDRKEEVYNLSREINQLKESVASLQSKICEKDQELTLSKDASMQLEVEKELRSRCELREEAERRERIAACAQLLATQTEILNLTREYDSKIAKCENEKAVIQANSKHELEMIEDENRKLSETIMGLESETKQLKHAIDNAETNHESVEQLGRVSGELEILRKRLREAIELKEHDGSAASSRILELEEQVRSGETARRKMHNTIQELRGNVRVFARVRPFLPNDGVDLSVPPPATIMTHSDSTGLKISRPLGVDERGEDHVFTFDRVFGPSLSQESVFQEVSEFVQSALDGYSVCLLSYGQTGSGKTHTMQGSGDGPMRGIIPRAMQQVGLYKNVLEEKGWQYEMEVSFIEIYNETIRDLLRQGAHSADLKHEIKKDAQGNSFVSDIVLVPVDPNNAEHIENVMQLAARHRSVSATAMNEQSSRSHSIFCLHLKATNPLQGTVMKGTLSLVDLAGSERLDRSCATGARMKETMAINKSLSALADVFAAIGNKQPHIPFRNSKLTYLLQPALSGDGKTLMMVNLSPTSESYFESLCSLRFASQVNQCELGKPKRNLKDINQQASGSTASNSAALVSSSATSVTGVGAKQPLSATSSSTLMKKIVKR